MSGRITGFLNTTPEAAPQRRTRPSRRSRDMFNFLNEHPTNVKLTKSQWRRHTVLFRKLQRIVESTYAVDAKSIVFRYGLIMMRICAIFTALRKWESKLTFTDCYCDDADFKTARSMVLTCVKHSLALFTMLPGGVKESQPAQSNEEVLYILCDMPDEFTWGEFAAALKAAHFSESTCSRALKKFVKSGLIIKKEGKYIKNKKALKKVSKRA